MNSKNVAKIFMKQALADLRDDEMGLREMLSDIVREDQLDQAVRDVEQAMRSAHVTITWADDVDAGFRAA